VSFPVTLNSFKVYFSNVNYSKQCICPTAYLFTKPQCIVPLTYGSSVIAEPLVLVCYQFALLSMSVFFVSRIISYFCLILLPARRYASAGNSDRNVSVWAFLYVNYCWWTNNIALLHLCNCTCTETSFDSTKSNTVHPWLRA